MKLNDKQWTNNNIESLNHVLKQDNEWKSKLLLDLIKTIENRIKSQTKNLRKAIFGSGEYQLADTHTNNSLYVEKFGLKN